MKNKILSLLLVFATLLPGTVFALEMPAGTSTVSTENGAVSAQSYLVVDKDSGEILVSKNPDAPWVPASLTKLVTAMVFLDTKPNMNKVVAIQKSDQDMGGCSAGGACIYTKPGVSYRLNDLFHASLIASANNATAAEARATGLSTEAFVKRMNDKAKALGATNTVFFEPTGMDPRNTTTASDYAKIVKAAFSNAQIMKAARLQQYSFKAYNNKKYSYLLKSTNKLINDSDLSSVVGKTGYLEESRYNFAADVRDRLGNNFIVVLFGSQNSWSEFQETKQLAFLAGLAKAFTTSFVVPAPAGQVAAASVQLTSY